MRVPIVVCCLLTLTLLAHAAEKPVVAFHGDSITLGARAPEGEKYPEVAGTLLDVAAVNAGVGGNTSAAGLDRLDKHVLVHKPVAVVLMFGTNDSVLMAPGKYRVGVADYEKNLREMVARCHAAGAKVVICTLPPIIAEPYYKRHPKEYYEPEGGLEAILQRYRAAAIKVAADMKVPVADIYAAFNGNMDPLKPDGVHPNSEGNRIIARAVAAALRPLLSR